MEARSSGISGAAAGCHNVVRSAASEKVRDRGALPGLYNANSGQLIVLSTLKSSQNRKGMNVLDTDFYVKTESGNVTIEKMK